jgi:hypothetical protein
MHKKFWVEKLKGTLGRSGRRWEDNIRIDLREKGWEITELIWLRIGICGGLL